MRRHDSGPPPPVLAAVLRTNDLHRRAVRQFDHATEMRRLYAVIREIANSPSDVLRRAAAEALLLCCAHSAGISLLCDDDEDRRFRREAAVGPFANYVGTTAPLAFSPYGVVVERDAPQLFQRPALYYSYLSDVEPPPIEVLLAPIHHHRRPVGALWVVLHDESRRFDREDARLLANLARCTSAAYQLSQTMADIEQSAVDHLTSDLERFAALLAWMKRPAARDETPWSRALSRRERDVCVMTARGLTNKMIGAALGLSEKTVATYRARAADKLGFRNRAELMRIALDEGWLLRWH